MPNVNESEVKASSIEFQNPTSFAQGSCREGMCEAAHSSGGPAAPGPMHQKGGNAETGPRHQGEGGSEVPPHFNSILSLTLTGLLR